MPEPDLFAEANRQLIICNACRYCEGYCPVFRAIEVRREFDRGDVLYLANLCHDCRACYYACMYTPPHEFAINIPKLMGDLRLAGYERWSWPGMLSRAFAKWGIAVLLGTLVGAAVIVAALFLAGPALFATHLGAGSFYQVIPYSVMVAGALALALYAAVVWIRGGTRFWSESAGALRRGGGLDALIAAFRSGLTLEHYRGGGPGCNYPAEHPSSVRRLYHVLTYAGFLSALISTTLAFFYQDLFRRFPPYPVWSAPVLFGAFGGIALMIGTAGLIWFKLGSDRAPAAGSDAMDYVFLLTLGLAALTGMLTLILRDSRDMGITLVVHLAFVAALFITAPYGKFVHALYRSLALVRYHAEHAPGRELLKAGHGTAAATGRVSS